MEKINKFVKDGVATRTLLIETKDMKLYTGTGGMELFDFIFEQESRREMGLPTFIMIYLPRKVSRVVAKTFKHTGHFTGKKFKKVKE